MINRREFLGVAAGAGATLAFTPELLRALQQPTGKLIQRAIPSTGEMLPVIGLAFSNHAGCADPAALKEVLKTFVSSGGKFFDTNFANERASQDAILAILNDAGIQNQLFLSWRGYPPGPTTPEIVKAHIESSLAKLKVPRLDMVDLPRTPIFDARYWSLLKEAKSEGRIRYISAGPGPSTDLAQLEMFVRSESIDFFSLAYSIENRKVEEAILPFAMEKKIAVMAHWPLGGAGGSSCVSDKGLFARVANTPLPAWAAEFDAKTWAQFFLKYVVSHPAVTVVRVGTTKTTHMLDDIGGGVGRLPNEAMRKRMAAFIDALPVIVPAAAINRYVGEFKSASGASFTFRREEATLFVKWGTSPEMALIPRSFTRFEDSRGAVFEFQVVPPGTVNTAVLEEGNPLQRTPLTRVR